MKWSSINLALWFKVRGISVIVVTMISVISFVSCSGTTNLQVPGGRITVVLAIRATGASCWVFMIVLMAGEMYLFQTQIYGPLF